MRKPAVLIVDDDAFSRSVVAMKLKTLARVVEAEDGHEAVGRLQSASFDLVIVDLEMPRFNGLQLIQWMRAHPTLRHIPIIVLTANEMSGGLESSFMAGTTSALLKPLDWGAFGEHVRHVLELAFRSNHMAMHDHLTGLANRVLLNERLARALPAAKPQALVAAHILDLDRFKQVNDTLGHPCGDLLLQLVAERLRKIVREADTVARMGGDEFVIVQEGLAHIDDATRLARRIIDVVSAPYELLGHPVTIGTTIGIAVASHDGHSPQQVLRDADSALYCAKRAGRGRFLVFEPDVGLITLARCDLAYALGGAVANNQLEVRYQPIVRVEDRALAGFEALVRWRHGDRGLLQPSAFLRLAEDNGIVADIDTWVIRKACADAMRWPDDTKVCVNVSPALFNEAGVLGVIKSALSATRLPAHRLELEITEAHLSADGDAALATLNALHELGVRVAIANFGVGQSSLSHLQRFPLSNIKMHHALIESLADNRRARATVQALAAFANSIDIASTAAGIETEEQALIAGLAGCSEMQGFLFGQPLLASDIGALQGLITPRTKIRAQ